MKAPISEIVGQTEAINGERVAVYRALRDLMCASCGQVIACRDLFTRRKLGGVTILPRCRKCAPFTPVARGESELLQSLLDESEMPKNSPQEVTPNEREKRLREVERRLGPALARSRRSRTPG